MLAQRYRFHGYNALNFAHKQGSIVRGQQLSLKYVKNERRSTYRVAVVVSKKVSKSAVVRNRIRRRVYEAVRAYTVNESYDLIFMIYSVDVATLPTELLQKTIQQQLKKAGVV